MNHAKQPIQPQPYFPYVTRRLLHLFDAGALTNVSHIDVDPEFGYVTRITYVDGSHRITYGNDLGVNIEAACSLAKDKGYSKFMLQTLGVACPAGRAFLLPNWESVLQSSSRQVANPNFHSATEADAYITAHFGYPAYIKPIDGSKGANIFKVFNASELNAVLDMYETKKIRLALIEEPQAMPDYRIVTLDGKLISAYKRIPLTITGDGVTTISELATALLASRVAQGREISISANDPRIITHLHQTGLSLDSIPSANATVILLPISNLATGGDAEDITDSISKRWVDLAAYIAQNFNLRLSGLDIACADIADDKSDYSVLEVNGTPGLDHYASAGETQRKLVDELYTKVLNTM